MSNKKQMGSNTSLLDLLFTNWLIQSLFQSSSRNLLLVNLKYFQHKQGRPCVVDPKWEGMPCKFENKLFRRTSV